MVSNERFDVVGTLSVLHDALSKRGHVKTCFEQRLGRFGAHAAQARETSGAVGSGPEVVHLDFLNVGDFSANAVQRLRVAQRVVLVGKVAAHKLQFYVLCPSSQTKRPRVIRLQLAVIR